MKKILSRWLVQLISVAMVVAGGIYEVQGAANLYRFMIWMQLLLVIICAVIYDVPPRATMTLEQRICHLVGWSTVMVCAWCGWWFTATADAIAMIYVGGVDLSKAKPKQQGEPACR